MTKIKHDIHLKDSNLKVTPQRIAVLEALNNLKNHPTADKIKEYVIKNHPNIAVGTIYKTLETFVEKGLVKKVKTEKDVMRYDAILDHHHHLYCEDTERIEDFFDDQLNDMIEEYFKKKKIPNFKVKDVKLQIIGTFKK
ncbi:MAG: transcriptional repressor [Ignavibacteriota bacterium]|nr:transcriptional repressor [Ignavibacteriales bacterium]MBL1121663.1 transcriptional repressor [Ignavibacteriota bacterium]MCC7094494.1 transcriptional repressor [Ignavibacteriaceae bacterium]MCE7856873.1 transcriptional repressor [Ignavibacteria bacterium CHB3]MCL4279192.1 transcriptional repressor [Ignavibacteriaceae bacterium]